MLIYEQLIALTCSGMFHSLHPARHCFHQQEQMALSTEFIPSAGSQLCTTGKIMSLYISNANFNFIVTLSSTYFFRCSFPNPFFSFSPGLSCWSFSLFLPKILAPTPAKSICTESVRGFRFYCAFWHPYTEGLFSKVVELE